jgi:hypothetical protein
MPQTLCYSLGKLNTVLHLQVCTNICMYVCMYLYTYLSIIYVYIYVNASDSMLLFKKAKYCPAPAGML